jgi:predicted chitinase
MLRPRARPVTSITDAVTNADVVTNGKVDMNKVENVILNTIGNNIYSAGLLGAIKIEVGEGVKDERPYSLSNLENFKGAWKERSENAGLIDPKTGMATKKAKELNKQGKLGETIFNVQYANRNGNGSIESGDGNKFKGRGLIQITGRSNYEAVGKKLGVDLIANPELVNTPEYAVPAAVAYMDINGFFELEPSQITKNTLQNLVNPNASSAVKNKRWRATTGYLKNNSSDTAELDETLRPRSRPNIIMASN